MIKKHPAATPVAKKTSTAPLKAAVKLTSKTTPTTVQRPAPKAISAATKIPLKSRTGTGVRVPKNVASPVSATAAKRAAKRSAAAGVSVGESVGAASVALKPASAVAQNDGVVSDNSLIDASDRPRKPKLVRDSFTMPEAEYAALGEVKKACLKAGYEVKKSELLRAGVGLIRRMDIIALKDILAALPPLKAGRPKKS